MKSQTEFYEKIAQTLITEGFEKFRPEYDGTDQELRRDIQAECDRIAMHKISHDLVKLTQELYQDGNEEADNDRVIEKMADCYEAFTDIFCSRFWDFDLDG